MKFKTYNELYEAIDSVGGNFEEKDHGEAPVSYADAVRRMNKKRKDVNKALEDHKNEYKDAFDNTEESKNSHKPMRRKETKKMGLSESLFEDVDEFNFTLALFKEGQKTRVAHLRDEDEVREFIKKHSSKYNAIEVYDELGHYRKDLSFITGKSLTEDWDDGLHDFEDYFVGQKVIIKDSNELIADLDDEEEIEFFNSIRGQEATIVALPVADGYESNQSWEESFKDCYWDIVLDNGQAVSALSGYELIPVEDLFAPFVEESLTEDTIKQNGKWMNKGKEGAHGKFKTKKAADAQRKAMFANGYKESLDENLFESDSKVGSVDEYLEAMKKAKNEQEVEKIVRDAKGNPNADKAYRILKILKEDVEINSDLKGVETTPNPPEAGSDNYVANTLNQLIVGEWDTIKDYNDFIATLETMNMSTDILNVVKDIVNEEHVHIGQLQQALKTVSPNAVSITDGEREGSEQLETQVEVGDTVVDGEIPTEHELEADTL